MTYNWFGKKIISHKDNSSKMASAKSDFEKACKKGHGDRNTKGFKIKIALRCRAVIDIIFIDGAKTYEKYADDKLEAIWNDNEIPIAPEAENYQPIKSSQGYIIGYIPKKFADKVFILGAEFQTKKITKTDAIERTQLIADEISLMLNVEESFDVLDFLRNDG